MPEEQDKKQDAKQEPVKEELTEEEMKGVSGGRARCPGTADLIRGDLK